MPAGYNKFNIEQGANFNQLLELSAGSNTPMDLTGYTGSSKMRRSLISDIDSYNLTVAVESPATLGKIRLTATATQTAAMTPGRYFYTVKITNGTNVERVIEGIIEVTPDATL